MLGGVASRTVTVKLQVSVFPALSVARQATGVIPLVKLLPLGGEQTTGTLPSQ